MSQNGILYVRFRVLHQ